MNWFVLYVKSGNEKKITSQLERLGVEVFCPMVIQIRQWSDRKKKVETPLFNSYVFVRLDEHERDIVFQVPRVFRYVFWLGKPAVARDQEILALKEGLKETMEKVVVTNIKKGDVLDVSVGPFKGKQGIVKEINGKSVQILLKDLGLKVRLIKAEQEAHLKGAIVHN